MDQPPPLRGASTVNDELEVGFDDKFEYDWWRLERVGRVGMCLVVAAAIAGALGAGPLDHGRVGRLGDGAVDYQPLARYATGTQLTLHLPPAVRDGEQIVTISSSFVEPFGLQTIDPQPIRQRSEQGRLELTFAVRGGGTDNYVRLHGKPVQVGVIPLAVDMPGRSLRCRIFVLP